VIHKTVQIQCSGRGPTGETVLPEPIAVQVSLTQHEPRGMVSVGPQECPHNTGGHGQRCLAPHPGQDEVGVCPFSFDYPYAREFPGWTAAKELQSVLGEFETT